MPKNILSLLLLIIPLNSTAQKTILLESGELTVTEIKNNLTLPWEIIWGPDDYIWFTHDSGKISRLNPNTGEVIDLLQISDIYPGGLTDKRMLGLALHPDFENQPFVFTNYTYKGDSYTELNWDKYLKIVRYEYDTVNDTLINPLILLDNIKVYDGWQIGGKLLADANNKLFMSIGDAKQAEHPENHPDWYESNTPKPLDLNWFNGKIIRINFDGTVPEDNPFAESPFEKNAKNLIWSLGHRNTQGLVFGKNQRLYYAEHGPANDDETGIIEKGGNYGWPIVEGFCNTTDETQYCNEHSEHHEPLVAWTPTIAPSNMEYYPYNKIPEFENSLLIATLTGTNRVGEDIRVITLSEDGTKVINEMILFEDNDFLRIRDLCISNKGDIYFTTSNLILNSNLELGDDDKIFKISYSDERVTALKQPESSAILYPNPSNGEVFLPCDNCVGKTVLIKDVFGRTLQTTQLLSNQLTLNFEYFQHTFLIVYMDNHLLGKIFITK